MGQRRGAGAEVGCRTLRLSRVRGLTFSASPSLSLLLLESCRNKDTFLAARSAIFSFTGSLSHPVNSSPGRWTFRRAK